MLSDDNHWIADWVVKRRAKVPASMRCARDVKLMLKFHITSRLATWLFSSLLNPGGIRYLNRLNPDSMNFLQIFSRTDPCLLRSGWWRYYRGHTSFTPSPGSVSQSTESPSSSLWKTTSSSTPTATATTILTESLTATSLFAAGVADNNRNYLLEFSEKYIKFWKTRKVLKNTLIFNFDD